MHWQVPEIGEGMIYPGWKKGCHGKEFILRRLLGGEYGRDSGDERGKPKDTGRKSFDTAEGGGYGKSGKPWGKGGKYRCSQRESF